MSNISILRASLANHFLRNGMAEIQIFGIFKSLRREIHGSILTLQLALSIGIQIERRLRGIEATTRVSHQQQSEVLYEIEETHSSRALPRVEGAFSGVETGLIGILHSIAYSGNQLNSGVR